MAITPVDLQTIFSQVEKVGKTQAQQREGQALAQAIQGELIQRKNEEALKQINEAQNTGEGAEKINDHAQRHNENRNKNKKNKGDSPQDEEAGGGPFVLSDLSLGRKIDISL